MRHERRGERSPRREIPHAQRTVATRRGDDAPVGRHGNGQQLRGADRHRFADRLKGRRVNGEDLA